MQPDLITRKVKLFHVVYITENEIECDEIIPLKYKRYSNDGLKNAINLCREKPYCVRIVRTYFEEGYYYMEVMDFLKHAKKGRFKEYPSKQKRILKPIGENENENNND